jgi:ATP-binding cassette subfamily B protein
MSMPRAIEPEDHAPPPGREPFEGAFRPFERMIDVFSDADDPKPPRDLRAFLRWSLGDIRGPVVLLAVFSLILGAAEAGVFYLVGRLVDRATAAGPDAFFAEEWPWLALLAFTVVVAKPLAQLCQNAMTSLAIGPGLNPMTIWRLHRHVLGQAMRYFEEDFTGRIAQKETQTANALTTVTVDTLTTTGLLVSYLVGMAAALGAADWRLALVVVVWAVLFAWALVWSVPRIRAHAKARAAARAMVTGQLVDSLSHIKTVKLFAHASREEDAARKALTDFRDRGIGFGRALMAMRSILGALNIFVMIATIGGALLFWHLGSATVGVVTMAAMMSLRLTQMSGWMSQSALSIFSELGTIEDGAITLSPAHEVTDRPEAQPLPEPVRGDVRYESVTFGYGRAKGGVRDLDLRIRAGEKIGLVGRSGAGKSTAVSLLLRLYDVERGRITIDGHDIRDVTQDSLRRAVSTVTQETAIFNRSALENVLYGRPDATREEAYAAARRAHAHDFILGLEDSRGRRGYEARLGERGVKLSGGQRQRIALARAILKDAPILVLDEATSALDSEVEADIQAALAEVMADKTVLAIAHRLSTIAAMDRIVVMDEGRIVEEGPHAALIARGGVYADLWERQSGGFLGLEAEAAE